MGMANGKTMAFALLAENRYGYQENHTDKLATKSRTRTAQRWTEVKPMPDCKYCQDEICVNADFPMCCDFCPMVDVPGVCRFEERGFKNE